jgi:urease accessory protein
VTLATFAAALQLADSAFPTGAFAQSFGLETAVVEGRVHDERSFEDWLRDYLEAGLAQADAAAIALVMEQGADPFEIDAVLAALTTASENRRALSRMAGALLDGYSALGIDAPRLRTYASAIAQGFAQGHPALCTAIAFEALDIACEIALTAYLSSAAAALGSAASRSVPLGQRSVARVLWHLRPALARCAEWARTAACSENLGTSAVEAEIDALRHRLLDARLFAS